MIDRWQGELQYGWEGDCPFPEQRSLPDPSRAELAEQELADFVMTQYVRSSVQRVLMTHALRERRPVAAGTGGQVA